MAAEIHNFAGKLQDPCVVEAVGAAVRLNKFERKHGSLFDALAVRFNRLGGPISINLDPTVACNYRCGHCIDWELLNTGHQLALGDILRSLVVLRLTGLRSVISIGGGEPTIHPQFRQIVRSIKALGLQCGIVSNGGNLVALEDAARYLRQGDWIRLSLDAASDATFQKMHRPRQRSTSLPQICAAVARIKEAHKHILIGFSFIIVWPGATVLNRPLSENLGEIANAAALAKAFGFDYISLKPLLDRDDRGSEVLFDPVENGEADVLRIVRKELAAAYMLEDESFRVIPSLNLTAALNCDDISSLRHQPKRCHMRLFRQVLTPMGLFGCPVYRGNSKDQIGSSHAYCSVEDFMKTRRRTVELTEQFDASIECSNVSCLYNSSNWWLESIYSDKAVLNRGEKVSEYFL